ncbi:MAG TPA: hypothetical protein IAA29_17125, partial [Candidatus Paenibacillus intestinavium]|nr:hypothetical protein [Candidatus Paenibacillus intestinavium]
MKKYILIFISLLFVVIISTAAFNYFKGHDRGVVVLMYHDFGYSKDPKIINAEVFEEHMAALAASKY